MHRRSFLASVFATSGCAVLPDDPNVGRLYSYTSELNPARRRPIVTIPGILGSRLRAGRDGEFVWGGTNRLSVNPTDVNAARQLALPLGNGTEPLVTLKDQVRADGVLRRARAQFLAGTIEQRIYDGLVEILNAGGYEFSRTVEEEEARRGENPGSLEFPYDWRRDLVEAAMALDEFVERKAMQIERVRLERYGDSIPANKMRFDFVAHSMGALVLRYWLMFGGADLPADGSTPKPTWAGANRCACLVFIAPPNLGSVSAFESLVNAKTLGPLQPVYPATLLATHPSTFQLMPRDRHQRVRVGDTSGPYVGSLYDVETWKRNRWGLFDPAEQDFFASLTPEIASEADRSKLATRHMTRVLSRTEQFHRAIDQGGAPRGPDMFLVAGTGLDTPASATFSGTEGLKLATKEEGDGVVLRTSALLDERQGGFTPKSRRRPINYRTTLLLPGEHLDLTHSAVFADNLLYWLLDSPRSRSQAEG